MKNGLGLLVFLPLLLVITLFTGIADKEVVSDVMPFNYSQYSLYLDNDNDELVIRVESFNPTQYKMALDDLNESFPGKFQIEDQTVLALQRMQEQQADLVKRIREGDENAFRESVLLMRQYGQQLLQNPLLDGKSIIAIKRSLGQNSRTAKSKNSATITANDLETGLTRQLTFDQDSNWSPVVMNDSSILYQRWEYTDMAHSNYRLLFTMNPDGTSQQAYYGSNSYFPTAFFNARPIPGHKTAVVGIVSGHHGVSRSGRMLVIDPAIGRKEADGVMAEIPYYGKKVQPIVRDRLVDGIWPQFLQPFPLSEKYFVVSRKSTPNSLWGLYLVDIFGNFAEDFSAYANFGDISLKEFAACTAHKNYESVRIIRNPGPYDDWVPRDTL